MTASGNFKVVIVGGGVAGLSLANMLERFDLDYVILESHSDIAPPVGASIGMFPNGLRILDQLGCFEAIKEVFGGVAPYNTAYTRGANGESLFVMNDFFLRMEKRQVNYPLLGADLMLIVSPRFGYGLYFFDRQNLLQILYDNLKHKEKVLLQKKVSGVNLVKNGVEVFCADRSVFSGTLVVGADGVHSQVRQSMTDLGHQLQPGYFDPSENNKVPCYYRCSFGIAQHVPNWVGGEQHMVFGQGCSQLVVSGPDDKVYWFLFEKLPETKYGKDIPKYTREDEAEFAKRNKDVPITTTVKWGDVYAERISSTLTPLHEVVYKKWFFQRIITLGDSAHKPNPLGGQGGQGAVESCTVLLNALLRLKDSRGGSLSGLSDAEIEQVFHETQSTREERAKQAVNNAHKMQGLFANESPALTAFVQKVLQPLVGDDGILVMMAGDYLPGVRIDKLPVPHRPRVLPFHDELPARRINDSTHNLVRGAFVGSMGLTMFLTKRAFRPPLDAVWSWMAENSVSLKWFGNSEASKVLGTLSSIFAVGAQDPGTNLHLWSFLPQLISPILIFTIEGYRRGNAATPLVLPSLFNAGMQVQGIGRMAPLHAVLSAFFPSSGPAGRPIPLEVARSLIPAVTLGFLIPTIMLLATNHNKAAWFNWVALWQFAPPMVNVLTYLFSKGLKKWDSTSDDVKQEEKKISAKDELVRDVATLKSVYIYAFAVQATAHIATMAYGWHHTGLSLADIFFKFPTPFNPDWKLPSLTAQLSSFFKYNMAFAVAGYVGGNLFSIWDLRRQGYVKTREAVTAALSVVAGQFLVGPGATWAGLWYWREDKVAEIGKVTGVE